MHTTSWRTALVAACVAIPFAALANQYEIVDLGSTVTASDLNDKGAVLGLTNSIPARAVVWRGGRWHHLAGQSQMSAINDRGDVVGIQYKQQQLKLWPRGQEALPIETPTGKPGRLYDVNDSRTVVGWFERTATTSSCFMWTPEQGPVEMVWPGVGDCQAHAVNEAGQVAGTAGGDAFLFEDGHFTDLGLIFGSNSTEGLALNRAGHVVGYAGYFGTSDLHAFKWNGTRLVDLNPKGYSSSIAYSINDHDKVVGQAHDVAGDRWLAVRFDTHGVVRLEDEVANLGGWQLVEARRINNDGVVLGFGQFGGTGHWFLLVPTP